MCFEQTRCTFSCLINLLFSLFVQAHLSLVSQNICFCTIDLYMTMKNERFCLYVESRTHTYARTHTAVVRILFVQTTYRVTSLTGQYLVWLTGEITAHGITLRHVHVMITSYMIRGDNVLNTMWPRLFSFWFDGYYQQ